MNTPTFITLPSGLRINTAHILEYREEHPGTTTIIQTLKDVDNYTLKFVEHITAKQLDAKLNPPQSPIVSPVIDLDRLRRGQAVQFTYRDVIKMGVFSGFRTEETREDACLYFRSDGDLYEMWTSDFIVTKVQ